MKITIHPVGDVEDEVEGTHSAVASGPRPCLSVRTPIIRQRSFSRILSTWRVIVEG